jgi:hypothetical protein
MTAVIDHDALPETCSEDGHIDGCPGRAGGEHELAFRYSRAPRTSWCFLCRRATGFDDYDSRTVTLPDGSEGVVCGRCIERADVGPDVPLTYEMQEGISDDD